ncbi:hypothetical protein H6G41_15465 [Tolypothrix sp. FACHB-123]|uniref:hypothetical protein n=1 Tax=Tolypothrix sp. FACHB-123 TaxID=2692868 RepID=UPI0016875047|nr:hypothetical protein [Tolypothrix sp. FACHB-123]MBD2356004.1 hypothetical protein [Tolypothrix sp. FACHB-123]
MREQVSRHKKTTTGFSIPTLKNPVRGFGLNTSQTSPPAVSLLQPLNQPPGHDISRISLLRPQTQPETEPAKELQPQESKPLQPKSLHITPKENKLSTIQRRENSPKPTEENQSKNSEVGESKPETENKEQKNQQPPIKEQASASPPPNNGDGGANPPPTKKVDTAVEAAGNPLSAQKQPQPQDIQANQGKGNNPGELPGANVANTTDKSANVPSEGEKAPVSPDNDPAFQAVVSNTKQVAGQEKQHPTAASKAQSAQAAAVAPTNEVDSKAQANHVGEMGQAPTPGFDAVAFKAKLMERIADMAPKNLDEADKFKDNNKLDAVKGDLSGKVKEEQKNSQGQLEEKSKQKPDTSGIEAKQVTPLPPTEPGAPPTGIGADKAAPKSKGQGEVEAPIQTESKKLDQQMQEADVTEEQLAKSNEPEFQGALTAKKEAQTNAQEAPPKYRQQEQTILATAQATATATAQQQLQAMHGVRSQNLGQVADKQVGAKGKDEQARAKIAGDINKIFDKTKAKVEKTLGDLDGQVIQAFDAGAAEAKKAFEDYVSQKMDKYKSDRYGGMWGWTSWIRDQFAGLPDEVNVFYQEGRQLYIQQMDGVINKVVAIISQGLTQAKAEIATGKQEIQTYVNQLPQDLKGVGQEAATEIDSKFDELEQSVDSKQDELIDTLAQKYKENLEAVDARIEEMKAANRGLIQKAFDFVVGVIKTIIELTKMLLEVLARVAGVVGQILKDPIGFLGNLIQAVKQGFLNFMKNIGKHLQQGLIGWLTGTMAEAGIEMPENFDLKGIFSLAMQLAGFTYQVIRGQAVKRLGEDKVSWMEQSVEVFQILASEGIAGIWQFVQDRIGDLNTLIIEPIKNFIIEKVIIAGVEWVLSLLTPASAFIKAAKTIYEIVKFFIERAQQIADLINAILDAIGAIASGSIDQAIAGVENALAKSLPVVISFLASLLGLGGIAGKIQAIFRKLRKPMEKAVDWIIDKGAKAFKKVSNKIKNSKFGKKAGKIKDKAVEKYKAGKQWVEDKKEAAQNWMEDKKQSVKDKFSFGKDKHKAQEEQSNQKNTKDEERTHEDKTKDLETAQKRLQGIISQSESTQQVEQSFPTLKKEFGLKKLEWDNLGTPSASVIMEINPKAVIHLNNSGLGLLNEGDTSHSNLFKQEVTFETHSIDNKYLVGSKMEATRLGPNHPQGSPPLGGALNPLMKKLPTDPSLSNNAKYVKGHLLNDNLGGPGSAQNLYPITADANKQHVQQVESVVKNWVNNQGYWVYYKVEVANEKADIANGVVNADLICEAAKLDVEGKKSFKGAFKTTVHSELTQNKKDTKNELDKDEYSDKDPIKDASFNPNQVEVSSGKKSKKRRIEEVE